MFARRNPNSLLVLVALLITTELLLEYVTAQGSCITPNKRQGICIPFLQCKLTLQILRASPTPLPNSVTQYLRDSHCGTFKGQHYGCCDQRPESEKPVSEKPVSEEPVSEKPVSTQHPRMVSLTAKSVEIRLGVEPNESLSEAGMLVLSLKGSACQVYGNAAANGQNSDLMEYPWVVLLVYDDGVSKTLECGGSLITDRHVLTAAHCILVRQPKKLVAARLGEYDIRTEIDCTTSTGEKICSPPMQEIDIADAVYHQDYTPSRFANDIGLLRLRTEAVFNSAVVPICLPAAPYLNDLPDAVTVVGWGNTEKGTRAHILQNVFLPIVDNEACQKIYRIIPITDKHLCAGGVNETHSCRGDSGGPLFQNFQRVQYGIISGGSRKCGTNFPDVYTRVRPFIPWITSNIAALN